MKYIKTIGVLKAELRTCKAVLVKTNLMPWPHWIRVSKVDLRTILDTIPDQEFEQRVQRGELSCYLHNGHLFVG